MTGIRQAVFLVALFGLLLFVAGCDEDNKPKPSPKVTVVEFTQDQESGNGIRVKFFNTTAKTHEEMQEEIQRQLESFVNGGQYDVVRVVTTRCSLLDLGSVDYWGNDTRIICDRKQPHLLSAEVYYRLKK